MNTNVLVMKSTLVVIVLFALLSTVSSKGYGGGHKRHGLSFGRYPPRISGRVYLSSPTPRIYQPTTLTAGQIYSSALTSAVYPQTFNTGQTLGIVQNVGNAGILGVSNGDIANQVWSTQPTVSIQSQGSIPIGTQVVQSNLAGVPSFQTNIGSLGVQGVSGVGTTFVGVAPEFNIVGAFPTSAAAQEFHSSLAVPDSNSAVTLSATSPSANTGFNIVPQAVNTHRDGINMPIHTPDVLVGGADLAGNSEFNIGSEAVEVPRLGSWNPYLREDNELGVTKQQTSLNSFIRKLHM